MSNKPRRIDKESAKDLLGLFLVLALIVAALLAFNEKFRDTAGDEEKAWYYERIAPPGSRKPDAPQRQTR